ncbi:MULTISPECIES: hypothetical protein [Campylobacterales]|jgi:hemerythrin|uniref:hypothetical protein n=1 Tax=Campylobacterales TaxID=213849 RepID=UPI002A43C5A0|nr:hypothetical protein [Arcobacteraceae bacterium]
MGTSKGTMPPSNGDWSSLKGDLTTLVNNIDIPNQEKKQKLTAKVVSDFITAIGGADNFASSSKSRKDGSTTIYSSKIGRATATQFGSFLGSIGIGGIQNSLNTLKINFNDLTIDELHKELIQVFSVTSNSDDANAANKAMAEVVDELFNEVDNIEDLETKILSSLETEDILCQFYERYIFKRFERNFDEYDIGHYGNDKARRILEDVESYIHIKLKTYQCDKKIKDIDFSTSAGEAFIQEQLQNILAFLEDYDD